MTSLRKGALICIVSLFLIGLPVVGQAQDEAGKETPDTDRQAVVELLKQQNQKLSRDLRRIQREIAALREEMGKPGLQEVVSGIGYILGLFGVAAYFSSRRKE